MSHKQRVDGRLIWFDGTALAPTYSGLFNPFENAGGSNEVQLLSEYTLARSSGSITGGRGRPDLLRRTSTTGADTD